jgi:hypothetical protein
MQKNTHDHRALATFLLLQQQAPKPAAEEEEEEEACIHFSASSDTKLAAEYCSRFIQFTRPSLISQKIAAIVTMAADSSENNVNGRSWISAQNMGLQLRTNAIYDLIIGCFTRAHSTTTTTSFTSTCRSCWCTITRPLYTYKICLMLCTH